MSEEELIELFWARDESAIVETKKKYGALIERTIRNVLDNDCDVEECINDSMIALWNSIPPNKPDKFLAFALRIAKNKAVSYLRTITRQKRLANRLKPFEELDEVVDMSNVEEEYLILELKSYIESFLDALSDFDRELMIWRYWFMESYEDIAKRYGMSSHRISMRICRLRKKLKIYLRKKGYLEEKNENESI